MASDLALDYPAIRQDEEVASLFENHRFPPEPITPPDRISGDIFTKW